MRLTSVQVPRLQELGLPHWYLQEVNDGCIALYDMHTIRLQFEYIMIYASSACSYSCLLIVMAVRSLKLTNCPGVPDVAYSSARADMGVESNTSMRFSTCLTR